MPTPAAAAVITLAANVRKEGALDLFEPLPSIRLDSSSSHGEDAICTVPFSHPAWYPPLMHVSITLFTP